MNILIEVTRQCNLKCDHCLRGEPENKVIQKKHVELLFSQLEEISLLTLTGGEPALWPSKIEMILSVAKKYKVDVQNFYIATNGTIASDSFLLSLIKLWLYCSENEISGVSISNDNFHDMKLIEKNLKTFEALSFVKYKYFPRGFFYDTDTEPEKFPDYVYKMENEPELILAQGRGINWGDKEIHEHTWDDFLENPDDAEFYLNCKGNIILGCDWSYKNQDDHILCNVRDLPKYLKELRYAEKNLNFAQNYGN
jgi:organic radical activating enzyme